MAVMTEIKTSVLTHILSIGTKLSSVDNHGNNSAEIFLTRKMLTSE